MGMVPTYDVRSTATRYSSRTKNKPRSTRLDRKQNNGEVYAGQRMTRMCYASNKPMSCNVKATSKTCTFSFIYLNQKHQSYYYRARLVRYIYHAHLKSRLLCPYRLCPPCKIKNAAVNRAPRGFQRTRKSTPSACLRTSRILLPPSSAIYTVQKTKQRKRVAPAKDLKASLSDNTSVRHVGGTKPTSSFYSININIIHEGY